MVPKQTPRLWSLRKRDAPSAAAADLQSRGVYFIWFAAKFLSTTRSPNALRHIALQRKTPSYVELRRVHPWGSKSRLVPVWNDCARAVCFL